MLKIKVLIAQLISDIGNWFYTIAISVIIYNETGSVIAFSATILFSLLPQALFSLLSGGFTDRLNAKSIIVVTNFLRGISVMFAIFVDGRENIYILYIIAFISALLSAPANSSKYVYIRNNFLEKDVSELISGLRICTDIALIFGAFLGVVAVSYLGINFSIILNSVSFFIAAIIFISIPYTHVVNKVEHNNVVKEYKRGLSYLYSRNDLKMLVVLRFIIIVATAVLNILPLSLGMKHFDDTTNYTGVIYTIIAIGAILGAFLSTKIKGKKLSYFILSITTISIMISYIIIGVYLDTIVTVFIGLFIVSASNILLNTYIERYFTTAIDLNYVGRISSIFMFTMYGAIIVSLVCIPILIDLFGLRFGFVICSLISIAAFVFVVVCKIFLRISYRIHQENDSSIVIKN